MSTIAQLLQSGQPDLELAAVNPVVLLAPYFGTAPLATIEDTTNGGLDLTKVGYNTSPFVRVGNFEKKAGVKLSNKPTANRIMSAGQGSPTRILFSESVKGITYTPQEVNLIALQNFWGFPVSALSAPSAKGGITIGIPNLPQRVLWRAVMICADTAPSGNPIYLFWIANRAEVADRQDVSAVDSNIYEHGVTLEFEDDSAEGVATPVIFGICGQGWIDLNTNNTGLYPVPTGLTNTVAPVGTTMTIAPGATHTKQLTILDNNLVNRTAQCTYAVTTNPTFCTVTTGGLITAVLAGVPVITATYVTVTGVTLTTTYSPTIS